MPEQVNLTGQMEKVFYPRSVAVVGVSSRLDNPGTMLLRAMMDMGFDGALYPVNPKYEEILGLECHASISSIPSTPDMAILSIPPDAVPGIIAECVQAGVSACVVSTAGFSESDPGKGSELEEEILRYIENSQLRIVGPNCLGIYSSTGKLALFGGQRPDEGGISCISQSGSIASMLYFLGMERALRFSKIVSSGNELDLNCSDYLDFFAEDPETSVIVAYLEEIRDARRFLETARGLKPEKPLIVWRAGLTETGSRAASSHTGAIAGREDLWNAAVEQSGIVPAESLSEVIDTAATFYHLKKPGGRKACVISPPGGIAVNSADAAERSGLLLPSLSARTRKNLEEVLPTEGTSLGNPVDMGFGAVVPGNLLKTIEAVTSDESIDLLIVVGGAPAYREGDFGLLKMHSSEIKEASSSIEKPMVVIGMPSGFAFPYMADLYASGIPCYLSPDAACNALSRYASFHGF